jgi:hypothetical protein
VILERANGRGRPRPCVRNSESGFGNAFARMSLQFVDRLERIAHVLCGKHETLGRTDGVG